VELLSPLQQQQFLKMSKIITIKLIKASPKSGPFTISDLYGNTIATDVSIHTLINGISYMTNDNVDVIRISSTGKCKLTKTINVGVITPSQLVNAAFVETKTACLWRHLVNTELYNNFYGNIEPYVLEYPFSYSYQDQIVQNIKDYTKVFKYFTDSSGVFSYNDKVELDDVYFNKAVVYNGQQSSGVLELVAKPLHNLHEYMKYPIYGTDSKTITFTKSDNFYQINNFWNILKDKSVPLFLTSCESLSAPKVVNQTNMDYGLKSFSKSSIRAKETKIRFELTNRSDVHLVSQFFVVPSQISYK
jgi:hypothetical protein